MAINVSEKCEKWIGSNAFALRFVGRSSEADTPKRLNELTGFFKEEDISVDVLTLIPAGKASRVV